VPYGTPDPLEVYKNKRVTRSQLSQELDPEMLQSFREVLEKTAKEKPKEYGNNIREDKKEHVFTLRKRNYKDWKMTIVIEGANETEDDSLSATDEDSELQTKIADIEKRRKAETDRASEKTGGVNRKFHKAVLKSVGFTYKDKDSLK
jgi:hypothetical protein